MTHYIALLRGVNVGGHRMLPMEGLRAALDGLGYAGVRTLLASGNLVFEAREQKTAILEKKLEADLARTLELTTDIMVRGPKEWSAIIAANPFVKEARADPSHLLVTVLKAKATAAAIANGLAKHKGPERVHVHGREIYVYYPEGMARTKLDLRPFGSGTARNWNTVLKLEAMVARS